MTLGPCRRSYFLVAPAGTRLRGACLLVADRKTRSGMSLTSPQRPAEPGTPRPAWVPLLVKKPLDSKVIKVLEDGRAMLEVAGTDAGVWKGMELSAEIPSFGEPEFVRAEVVEVEPKTCVVRRISGRESIEFQAGLAVHSRLKRED